MKSEKHLKQQKKAKHLSKKKSKNANFASDDHLQQIPQRLREIMKSKERMKEPQKKKKASKPAIPSGDIPVPQFRRGQRESVNAYVCRMTEASKHVMFLTNNQAERRPEFEQKKEKEQAEEKKSTKKTWLHKGKRLQQKKKLNQAEKREEQEMFKDEVTFGEVAMAPPSLSVKPKKASVKPQGASKGLLLTSLLGHSPVSVSKPSMAKKRMMAEERERVVQLYRKMKQSQRANHEQKKMTVSHT